MPTSPRRAGRVLVAFAALLMSRRSAAEGQSGPPRRASTATRVYGADFLKPVAGGMATVGGSTLRYLPPGGRSWENVLTVHGHLSRLGIDDPGARLMAVWEKEELVHLVGLRDHRHTTFPLPPLAAPGPAQFLYVHSLAFVPDGRDALVYLAGPSRLRHTDLVTRAYRQPLDTTEPPALLWEIQNGGDLLWSCGRGALYILPHDPNTKWSWRTDLNGHLAVLDVAGGTVTERSIFEDPANKFRWARVAGGSTPERLVAYLETGRGGYGLFRYRWGDARGEYQPLPPGPGPSTGMTLSPGADEVLYLVDRGRELEVVRRALPPSTASRSTPLWSPTIRPRVRAGSRTLASAVSTMGIREGGGIWIQLGDDMALIDSGGRVRRARLDQLVGGHPEWAGSSVYVAQPEGLWIGIEVGAGRDFVWLTFAEMERRATPWPDRPAIPPVSAERPDDRDRMTKCLPPEARIATPAGEIPVSRLAAGMAVWTRDAAGRRVHGTVLKVRPVRTAPGHRMVRLVLADGRRLTVSPGHPLPGGAGVERLAAGGRCDGAAVLVADQVAYAGAATWDLLPSGPTGIYWADGVPLASTLSPPATR